MTETQAPESTPETGDVSPPPAGESEQERIARRAYEIYQARGGTEGQALEDWLSAERELGGERQDRGGTRSNG